ncbi:MAG: hypothetical protein ACI9ND_001088 [Yoonia sp.]|jgi:hypothetical protein
MTYISKKLIVATSAFGLMSGAAWADQVILDDLIVDGSICVGQDCVNGESFGFDTIRMKENNLRIKALDTSSSASFPTVDWQLTFNDSSNGGQNKFSVDNVDTGATPFTIESGSNANALYVDDGGRVGFGTAAPVVQLHVVDGNTPTLRLEQDGSSGFTAQTWDVAGNEANFFVRDATNGSNLPLRIAPGADTNSISIGADNDVGMGVQNALASLHVKRNTGALADMLKLENNSDVAIVLNNTASGAATPEWKIANFQGDLFFGTPTTAGREMTLSNTGDLTITGQFISGTTTLAVPDYVFEEGYDLLPLAQVQTFINENGHLPRVPSAQDLAKTGINLSQMQMKLLEKVEELTLYTLEQQKQIASLQTTVKDLQAN